MQQISRKGTPWYAFHRPNRTVKRVMEDSGPECTGYCSVCPSLAAQACVQQEPQAGQEAWATAIFFKAVPQLLTLVTKIHI